MRTGLDFFGIFMLPGSELMWGLILGIVPEIVVGMVLWNRRLRKSLRKDVREQLLADVDEGLLDPAINRATQEVRSDVASLRDLVNTDDVQTQIEQVQARLEELNEGLSIAPVQEKLEALDTALGTHLQALHDGIESLPNRLKMGQLGSQGVEMRELYKAGSAAEKDAIEVYEAELTPEERMAAKIDQMEPSDDYREKHQVGAMIIDGVKEYVKASLLQRRGVVNMRRVPGTKGGFPNVYGD